MPKYARRERLRQVLLSHPHPAPFRMGVWTQPRQSCRLGWLVQRTDGVGSRGSHTQWPRWAEEGRIGEVALPTTAVERLWHCWLWRRGLRCCTLRLTWATALAGVHRPRAGHAPSSPAGVLVRLAVAAEALGEGELLSWPRWGGRGMGCAVAAGRGEATRQQRCLPCLRRHRIPSVCCQLCIRRLECLHQDAELLERGRLALLDTEINLCLWPVSCAHTRGKPADAGNVVPVRKAHWLLACVRTYPALLFLRELQKLPKLVDFMQGSLDSSFNPRVNRMADLRCHLLSLLLAVHQLLREPDQVISNTRTSRGT
mmetsp:Transcript_28484/g.90776  ORF Transcript_28484/g.90776 Transcript_28484/m.90776 type:complete len:313 (-) Transcript_28484:868-1806(-)